MKLLVRRAGFLSTVQDLGRTGHRQSGVSLGGALDGHALKILNLLVGNNASAAGLELTLGTVRLHFADDRLVAWGGGDFRVQMDALNLPAGHAGWLRAEEELILDASAGGGRAWLAISGGIDVPKILGSRSTDLRAGFGGFEGRALRDGDALPLGRQSKEALRLAEILSSARIADWFAPQEWMHPARAYGILRIILGVDWARFPEATQHALLHESFRVAADSDRMGIRLEGPELARRERADLLSEAVAPGTIQVPPNGQPILLLGDCQTIGGYPKIAHVITVDLAAAVQLRAGDTVRFGAVTLEEAQSSYRQREDEVARFRIGLALRTA
ncbi:MAG: biotin-dependent carboxyltransferase family protein [Chthoniobacterales bacterium]